MYYTLERLTKWDIDLVYGHDHKGISIFLFVRKVSSKQTMTLINSLFCMSNRLLLLFLTTFLTTTLSSLSLLPADTTRTTTTEGRGESEVNVLLRVETDHVRGDVDDLLANTEVRIVRLTTQTHIIILVIIWG